MPNGKFDVCILGLGYIGLPMAAMFASSGRSVLGVDIDAAVLERVSAGQVQFEEPGLSTLVQSAVQSGRLRVAPTPASADAYIIAVPTPLGVGHLADLSFVERAAVSILPYLARESLVVLESTSPPGTTTRWLTAILERSGLRAGVDFSVAYCPERVLPGRTIQELTENDRVIGGIDDRSRSVAAALYGAVVRGKIVGTDATTAEMIKLVENSFRDVNIAFANEIAWMCARTGVDAREVVRLANLHPRVNVHHPGPGVGGHCISVDPWFLVQSFGEDARLVALARTINDAQPPRVARWILSGIEQVAGAPIALLGASYKANVDDTRESPTILLAEELARHGAQPRIHDPLARKFPLPLLALEDALRGADAAVLVTDHAALAGLDPRLARPLMRRPVAFDTRGAWVRPTWEAAGFRFLTLGEDARPVPSPRTDALRPAGA